MRHYADWELILLDISVRNIVNSYAVRWSKGFEDKISEVHKFQLRQLTDQIISLERIVADIEKRILDSITNYGYTPLFELLQTTPGIGKVSAYTMIAEIGDFARFPNPEAIACFSGLTPRVFQSGTSCRHGKMNKQGPANLRWILQQCAWVAIRTSPFIRKIFTKISKKAGKKKATCAIARKLLIWSWAVVKTNTPFNKEVISEDRDRTEKAA